MSQRNKLEREYKLLERAKESGNKNAVEFHNLNIAALKSVVPEEKQGKK